MLPVRYGLSLVTAPVVTPVSVAEVKDHMRVEIEDGDPLITGYVAAATRLVERRTSLSLITTTWDMSLDSFFGYDFPTFPLLWGDRPIPQRLGGGIWPYRGTIFPPRAPLQSVVSITYIDALGSTQTLATSEYKVDAKRVPGRITPAYGKVWPVTREESNAVTIQFKAGFGDAPAAVPDTLRLAIKLLVANWYENREPLSSPHLEEMPYAVACLIGIEDTGVYR